MIVGEKEQWVEITGLEGKYEISNSGTVRNFKTKHVLVRMKSYGKNNGSVCISINGVSRTLHVNTTLRENSHKFKRE